MNLEWNTEDLSEIKTPEKPLLPNKTKLNHELRSALHALLGYLDIFRDEVHYSLDEDQNEILNKISYFANRLIDLIDDLLSLMRSQVTTS